MLFRSRRPHQIGSLLLDYGIAGSTTHLNVGLDFHGEQRDTEFLNVKPFSRPVILKSYKLLRVAGSYDLGSGLALTGRIENALDQKYEEVFGYRTRGLTATVGLSAQFGE